MNPLELDLLKQGIKGMKWKKQKAWIDPKGKFYPTPEHTEHINHIHSLIKDEDALSSQAKAFGEGWVKIGEGISYGGNGLIITAHEDTLNNKNSMAMQRARRIFKHCPHEHITISDCLCCENIKMKDFVQKGRTKNTKLSDFYRTHDIFSLDILKAQKGAQAATHKYVERILVNGKYRYLYASDKEGRKRTIPETTRQHVAEHNKDLEASHRLAKDELQYIQTTAQNVVRSMLKNGISGSNEQQFSKAFTDYLKKKGELPDQLEHKLENYLSKGHLENFLANVNLYHKYARDIAREHLLNLSEPIHLNLPKEPTGKIIPIRPNDIKRVVGQPEHINKKYPHYHPKAMPTKKIKGENKSYYHPQYVKDVPPRGVDKELWGKAVDEYLRQNGQTGYHFDFDKLGKIYSQMKGGQSELSAKHKTFKKTDMVSRQFLYNNPPEYVGGYKDIWKLVVDRILPKDEFGSKHIQKRDIDKKEAGLNQYFFNKVAKMKREGLIKGIFFFDFSYQFKK